MSNGNLNRYLMLPVTEDLSDRMVFVGGPRQVGKTTFALGFLDDPSTEHPGYLNWDVPASREPLLRGELPANQSMLILDEIHKHPDWRNLVKGFFDVYRGKRRIIVTGSARLDYYSKGGDSLQGRYHMYRLHPFSLVEIPEAGLDALLRFGGFPEPLLKAQERFWRRWQLERMHRVIHDDVRDMENVQEIGKLDLLATELPARVGAPLSVESLRKKLCVAHATVVRWLEIFERMYISYRIAPYGASRIRAVRKEQKLYLWDWSLVPDAGPRFENLVASHLLKYCHYVQDTQGYRMELRFIRDTDRREVDFVVLRDGRPLFAVECKSGQRRVSPHIFYFAQRTDIPRFYQVHAGTRDYEKDGFRVLPFHRFCDEVGLV